MKALIRYLSLFGSTSTLFCCAIPSLLVSVGMGSAFASLLSVFPQLEWLGDHKGWVFGFAGVMLAISGFEHFKKRQVVCVEGSSQETCQTTRSVGKGIWILSLLFYGTGVWFAFIRQ